MNPEYRGVFRRGIFIVRLAAHICKRFMQNAHMVISKPLIMENDKKITKKSTLFKSGLGIFIIKTVKIQKKK
ncbi:MAG: hypothetical protein SOT58_11750 [Agathobacter sp.]|nr:hypothetical protein [Agathobacter sp.]